MTKEQAEAFIRELHELCKKHDVSDFYGYGDDAVATFDDGSQLTINDAAKSTELIDFVPIDNSI